MITIKPSAKHAKILQFDGQVLEIFNPYQSGSHRLHVGLLTEARIEINRNNNHKMTMRWTGDPILDIDIDESELAAMIDLVNVLQTAITANKR